MDYRNSEAKQEDASCRKPRHLHTALVMKALPSVAWRLIEYLPSFRSLCNSRGRTYMYLNHSWNKYGYWQIEIWPSEVWMNARLVSCVRHCLRSFPCPDWDEEKSSKWGGIVNELSCCTLRWWFLNLTSSPLESRYNVNKIPTIKNLFSIENILFVSRSQPFDNWKCVIQVWSSTWVGYTAEWVEGEHFRMFAFSDLSTTLTSGESPTFELSDVSFGLFSDN